MASNIAIDIIKSIPAHLLKRHDFLSGDHESNELRTWAVILLCAASMIIEIVCGVAFGSLALIADGIHMSTHCIAFFITASAYSYARKHSSDPRFVFGTGKVGELAAYTSAIILIIIALYILYEGISRFVEPIDLDYLQALPVAFVGLSVNIASGVLLGLSCNCNKKEDAAAGAGGFEMAHGHGHGHSHGHNIELYEFDENYNEDDEHLEEFEVKTPLGVVVISIFEENCPPVFRIRFQHWTGAVPDASNVFVTTLRPTHAHGSTVKTKAKFLFGQYSGFLQSTSDIPEPHEFTAVLTVMGAEYTVEFKEDDHHGHGHGHGHEEQSEDHGHEHGHDNNPKGKGHDDHDHSHAHNNNNTNDTINALHGDHNHEGHDHDNHDYEGHEHEHGHDHFSDCAHIPCLSDHHHSETQYSSTSPTATATPSAVTIPAKKVEKYEQDNNFRAAIIHVVADAVVSVMVIVAIVIAGNVPEAYFLDPLVAVIGAFVIISWGYTLIVDTSCNLLDMSPDMKLAEALRKVLEKEKDTGGSVTQVTDLHVWRLGPGHLGAIISVLTNDETRTEAYYSRKIKGFKALSHATIEVIYSKNGSRLEHRTI